jgi:hypothetical protein
MAYEKIVTNEELLEGLSGRIRGMDTDDEPNLAEIKVYGSLSGRIISSVKRDMEAAEKMGRPYLPT